MAGRNRDIEIRKLSCKECKQAVSVAAFNLPMVTAHKVAIICEGCFKAMEASGRHDIEKRAEPLRSLGIED